ncbi:MAG TPA: FAD-dependent oxidoreductase, partial [Anaerovoracaceae bacterium]|nr:FAD-dependent oxidoreductase [Anaerovoracaceae bacterium]
YQTVFYTIPTIDMPVAFNVDSAATIKSVVSIPVITVGRINDPLVAEKILEDGKADFVSIGRGQIADPEFCNKAMNDDFDAITKCIGCIQGCFDVIFGSGLTQPACCLLNPTVGFEKEFEGSTTEPKKVLIAGAGPGGLEAAIMLKKKGHEVILCEKDSKLGGQFFIAGIAPRKGEFSKAAESLGERAVAAGVDIRLQTMVTPELIDQIKPDFTIIATGSEPIVPGMKGIDGGNVFTAHDILKGNKTAGGRVVVIGGGLVGLETAEFLAKQKKEVTVVEMLDDVGKDMGFIRKVVTSQHIGNAGIRIITNAKCTEIGNSEVQIEKDGKLETLTNIDSVVIAVGSKPYNQLEEYLKDTNLFYCVIGDAKSARKALDAIREAAEISKNL